MTIVIVLLTAILAVALLVATWMGVSLLMLAHKIGTPRKRPQNSKARPTAR